MNAKKHLKLVPNTGQDLPKKKHELYGLSLADGLNHDQRMRVEDKVLRALVEGGIQPVDADDQRIMFPSETDTSVWEMQVAKEEVEKARDAIDGALSGTGLEARVDELHHTVELVREVEDAYADYSG